MDRHACSIWQKEIRGGNVMVKMVKTDVEYKKALEEIDENTSTTSI